MVNVVEANPGTPGVRSEYTLDRTPIYHDTYACTHTLYCSRSVYQHVFGEVGGNEPIYHWFPTGLLEYP